MSLAAIHITKKELGLTESEYRAILREVAGVDSAKYLDESGDRAVMARLYALRDERRLAAKSRPKAPRSAKSGRSGSEVTTVRGCGTTCRSRNAR